MRRAALVACACLFASAWPACSAEKTPLTQIVVAVDSDWDGFERADIEIRGFEKTTTVHANLSKGTTRHVALVHEGGPLGPMAITVRAYADGRSDPALVEPRTGIYFVKNETRLLRIDLLLPCVDFCKDGQACIAGPTCVDSDEAANLTDWNGDIGAIETKYHVKDGDVLPGDGGTGGTNGGDSGSDGGQVSGTGGHGGGDGGGSGGQGGSDATVPNDAGDSGHVVDTDTGTPDPTVFKYTPSNVDPDDSDIAGLSRVDVSLNCADPTFDSSDLSFTGWCGMQPEAMVVQQDATHDAAVIAMSSLELGSPATLHLKGDKPIILLVYGDANIDGVIEASAHGATPGPGAERDCVAGTGADGTDGSGLYISADGAGGGGFGSAGGTGAPSNGDSTVIAGGGVEGNLTLVPLRGGCRGGKGGMKGGGSSEAPAGAGGGAVQISASGRINISGSVLAVGGGGGVSAESMAGGAGGGSGGAVLLEGASVALDAAAVISVNGGGGGAGQSGGGTPGVAGEDGHGAASAALGGPQTSLTGSYGGAGGPGAWRDADAGNGGKPGVATVVYGGGGGAGGGVGRIRVNNAPSCMPAGVFTPRPAVSCKSCGTCADPALLGCVSSTNGGVAYAVCASGVSWTTARDRCIAADMHLARIDNSTENTWLAAKVSGNTWIGGNDMSEDNWIWVDNSSQFWAGDEAGSQVTYAAWLSGEPNDSPSGADCAAIGTDAKWRDFNCNNDLLPYACEHAP